MKERLLEFVRYTGLPVYQFEKVCGLSNAYIKNISKGIGADKLEKILNQFPQLNKSWLLTGKGDMLLPSAEGDSIHHNTGNVATRGAQITTTATANNDQLIATLQARIATMQSQIDAQHENADLLKSQIATLQSQIADLRADKQNLMQLLTNLTQNK